MIDQELIYKIGHDAAEWIPTSCRFCGHADHHLLTLTQRRAHPYQLKLLCDAQSGGCGLETMHVARKR